MADLAKVPNYGEESDYLSHITKVILHLLKYMQEHPVLYPPVMRVYSMLLFGVSPCIKVKNCPHDSECEVNAPLCGGFENVLDVIEEAYDCLQLEEDLEAPSYVYPADYSI